MRSGHAVGRDGEQGHALAQPLEDECTAILEGQVGAGYEIAHRSGDQYLPAFGYRGDPCGDVDRNAADVVPLHFDLARMDAASNLQVQLPQGRDDRVRATDGTSRAIERSEETVAEGLDLMPAIARKFDADDLIVLFQYRLPAPISDLGCPLRGIDDVGEQHRREDPVRPEVVFTGLTLSLGVVTWVFSPIKFQADMGVLLTFMFLCNMLVALVLVPALACYLLRPAIQAAQPATSLKEISV